MTATSSEGTVAWAAPPALQTGSDCDPALMGFTQVSNYAHYFWRPYLGNAAFGLWELLLSFCYGEVDTAYPSISRLARMLTNSDHSRAVVTGRAAAGGRVQRGALDVLRHEGLVEVRRHGRGPTVHYSYRVRKRLPLLTAEQVARLSPTLQLDHSVWLERHGLGVADEDGPGLVAGRPDAAAAGSSPAPAGVGGAVSATTGAAGGSTNNTQPTTPINQWWQAALMSLQAEVPLNAYRTVLLGVRPVDFAGGVLTLRAPSAPVAQALQARLLRLVVQALVEASDGQATGVLVTGPEAEARP